MKFVTVVFRMDNSTHGTTVSAIFEESDANMDTLLSELNDTDNTNSMYFVNYHVPVYKSPDELLHRINKEKAKNINELATDAHYDSYNA